MAIGKMLRTSALIRGVAVISAIYGNGKESRCRVRYIPIRRFGVNGIPCILFLLTLRLWNEWWESLPDDHWLKEYEI